MHVVYHPVDLPRHFFIPPPPAAFERFFNLLLIFSFPLVFPGFYLFLLDGTSSISLAFAKEESAEFA